MTTDLLTRRRAEFSPCGLYRYYLEIRWDDSKPFLVMLMLNPSTADAEKNDPTVERCEQRARVMGFGGLIVLNLFAFKATDPKDMKAALDPVGPENNAWLLNTCIRRDVGMICAGWGAHGSYRDRAAYVAQMVTARAGRDLHALELTKDGQPRHPLYLPYRREPFLWKRAA